MWLRVYIAICINTTSKVEKWICASLCGHVEQLLTFVTSDENDGNWYDVLWVLTSYYHNNRKNKKLSENDVFRTLHIIDKEWEKILSDFNAMFIEETEEEQEEY
eukprot:TRINITY_DN227_c0_g1_i1.p1 TRINITY_DN227_c0_g1~~TRINITY_DN227_c0_g1_i1.p1  ORF type:complete len:104 (+),score=26.25 TRINITY_DN227_c0_g1_i1:323-634(+)